MTQTSHELDAQSIDDASSKGHPMAHIRNWKPNCYTDGRVLAAANCLSVGGSTRTTTRC
jgi:hypothetical protein